MRIDQWLYCVRIFKTRARATAACRGNLVSVNNESAKASREVKPGDVISIQKDIAVRQARALDFPQRRVAARDVDRFYEDQTAAAPPRSRFSFLDDTTGSVSAQGGKPDKKERRARRLLFEKD